MQIFCSPNNKTIHFVYIGQFWNLKREILDQLNPKSSEDFDQQRERTHHQYEPPAAAESLAGRRHDLDLPVEHVGLLDVSVLDDVRLDDHQRGERSDELVLE